MVLWHLSDWTTVAVQYKSTVVAERVADTTRSLPRNFKIAEYEPLLSGPAAGQGFSGRLQCEHGSSLSEAIAETPRLLPCEVPSNEVATIVTMFVANPQVYGPQPSHASGLWLKSRREERRLRLLSVFLQSVEVFCAFCHVTCCSPILLVSSNDVVTCAVVDWCRSLCREVQQ